MNEMDEMFHDWMTPAIGVLLEAAQHPPRGLSKDQKLHWRTGYQNAISDLIKMRHPMAAGGARLTAKQVEEHDKVRVRTPGP